MADKSIHAAMAKAFAAIEGATKDTNNPFFKTKYADLGSVVAAIKPALVANDLWFRQASHERDGGVCIETIVGHASGEEISFGNLFVPAIKNDPQAFGSAMTYARRYSLQSAFGVCPEDDDGNAASKAATAAANDRINNPAPAPKKEATEKWQGAYSGKSALHKGMVEVDRNIRGCGDSAELEAYLTTPEYRSFIWSCEKYMPHYLVGGDPAPPEFVGVLELVNQMRQDFNLIENSTLRAG